MSDGNDDRTRRRTSLSEKQLAVKWDANRGFWVPGLRNVECPTFPKMATQSSNACVTRKSTNTGTSAGWLRPRSSR